MSSRLGIADLIWPAVITAVLLCALLMLLCSCASNSIVNSSGDAAQDSVLAVPPSDANEDETLSNTKDKTVKHNLTKQRQRVYVPLTWDATTAPLVGRQGTTALWGACGQCCIANTLNLVTGTTYTEADIVDYTLAEGLCDPATGGMTLDDIVDAYDGLLPLETLDVYGYGGTYAPTLDGLAQRLEKGIILNAAVYGEMMREGGHTGEGDVYSTHWIVLHYADRAEDGSVAGFGIVDSASSMTYLTAQEFSDIYYGHDGTTIIDPSCIQVYGWKYADE